MESNGLWMKILQAGMESYRSAAVPAPGPKPVTIEVCGYIFSCPTRLPAAELPSDPGVYVIFARRPLLGSGRRPLYVGKAVNLATRVSTSHEKYQAWRDECRDGEGLYVSTRAIWGEDLRVSVERQLIQQLNPPCNIQHNSFTLAALLAGGIGLSDPPRPRGLLSLKSILDYSKK